MNLTGHEKHFFENIRKQAFFFFIRIHKLSVAAERFETWGREGGGAHLALSHTHSSNQIFQNTVCVVR